LEGRQRNKHCRFHITHKRENLAVANHFRDFSAEQPLATNHKNKCTFFELFKKNIKGQIRILTDAGLFEITPKLMEVDYHGRLLLIFAENLTFVDNVFTLQ